MRETEELEEEQGSGSRSDWKGLFGVYSRQKQQVSTRSSCSRRRQKGRPPRSASPSAMPSHSRISACGSIRLVWFLATLGFYLLLGVSSVAAALPAPEDAPVENLVRNGNFEDLAGHFPAGVLVFSSAAGGGGASRNNNVAPIPHWDAEIDSPVEIISSLSWRSDSSSSAVNSKYLLHLNSRAGPGSVLTNVPIPSSNEPALYRLSFQVAGNPAGGPQVRSLEVDVNPRECRPKALWLTGQEGANWQRLNWQTVHLVFEVRGPQSALTLRFRSLTPGSYGPLMDNVQLIALQGEEDKDSDGVNDGLVARHLDLCNGDDEDDETSGERRESSIQVLMERAWIASETWIRQRFFRRYDW